MDAIPMLSLFVILDAVHGVQAGNVRALGRQSSVTLVTLLCYYILGLPICMLLGFKLDWKLKGFWAGYVLAMTIVDCFVAYIVINATWEAKYILTGEPNVQDAQESGKNSAIKN